MLSSLSFHRASRVPLLVVIAIVGLAGAASTQRQRFFPDDPIAREPESQDASKAAPHEIKSLYEMTYNLFVTAGYKPLGTRAKNIGLMHGGVNVVVVLLFIGSWLLRNSAPQNPSSTAFALSFIAVPLALVGGWLGGELVDRLGVGVDDGAHLDAPNSLSGRPARERTQPEARDFRRVA